MRTSAIAFRNVRAHNRTYMYMCTSVTALYIHAARASTAERLTAIAIMQASLKMR